MPFFSRSASSLSKRNLNLSMASCIALASLLPVGLARGAGRSEPAGLGGPGSALTATLVAFGSWKAVWALAQGRLTKTRATPKTADTRIVRFIRDSLGRLIGTTRKFLIARKSVEPLQPAAAPVEQFTREFLAPTW
jgi:hypothetical protein